MRRAVPVVAAIALAVGLLTVAGAPAAAAETSTLRVNHSLTPGHRLVSPNGRYEAVVDHGRAIVRTVSGHTVVWRTRWVGAAPSLFVGGRGQLVLRSGRTTKWTSGTARSGRADVLALNNYGTLVLSAGGLAVWTSRLGNGCPARGGKLLLVDLSQQVGRMCAGGRQLRVTYVTTGMSAYGYGTPTGTWHVQARVRDTTLYPAAGGAYHVDYWVPYDGVYGVHDSSWQRFPYGSPKYRTNGSHGCVHLPHPMMAWFYDWARVGSTTVTVRA